AVHRLELDLHAQRLLGGRHHLLVEHLVGGWNEVDPLEPVHGLLLRKGWRTARGEDSRHTGGRHCSRATGKLNHATTLSSDHYVSSTDAAIWASISFAGIVRIGRNARQAGTRDFYRRIARISGSRV